MYFCISQNLCIYELVESQLNYRIDFRETRYIWMYLAKCRYLPQGQSGSYLKIYERRKEILSLPG